MINAIITQLESIRLDGKPIFSKVEEAIDLSRAMDGNLSKPVAYVIEVSRRPGKDGRTMGNSLQLVKTTIGIVIGIGKTNDLTGKKAKAAVTPILNQVRESLFGFEPGDGYESLLLGNADTVGVSKSGLWQLERFTTEHYEEAKHG